MTESGASCILPKSFRKNEAVEPVSMEVHIKDSISSVPPKTILEMAHNLVYGDRQADYGDAVVSFSRIADLWSAILGVRVSPRKVALCMAALKISREVSAHKDDNLADGCGYLELARNLPDE